MSVGRVLSRLHLERLSRAVFATTLVALALPAAAAQESLLEISFGPHETNWFQLKGLKVLLDGAPLSVTLPSADADSDQPIYSGAVKPGGHQIELEAEFTGNSAVFPYVEGYVFRMHDQLHFDAAAGEAVRMQFKVVKVPGITVQWTDRFRLALQASHHPVAQVPEAPATAAAPQTETETPAPAPVPAATCVLEPPHFAFARHELDAAGRGNLDRFADCLAANGDAVVIEGFTDPRGSRSFNEWLGEKRAKEATQYLAQRGVASSRLTVRSFGKTRLVCTERTRACFFRNRRVEAVVRAGDPGRE